MVAVGGGERKGFVERPDSHRSACKSEAAQGAWAGRTSGPGSPRPSAPRGWRQALRGQLRRRRRHAARARPRPGATDTSARKPLCTRNVRGTSTTPSHIPGRARICRHGRVGRARAHMQTRPHGASCALAAAPKTQQRTQKRTGPPIWLKGGALGAAGAAASAARAPHCAHHWSVGVCLAPHWAQKFGIDLPPPTPFRATLVNSIQSRAGPVSGVLEILRQHRRRPAAWGATTRRSDEVMRRRPASCWGASLSWGSAWASSSPCSPRRLSPIEVLCACAAPRAVGTPRGRLAGGAGACGHAVRARGRAVARYGDPQTRRHAPCDKCVARARPHPGVQAAAPAQEARGTGVGVASRRAGAAIRFLD